MKIFPDDWSWHEKLSIILGIVVIVGFVAFLFIGCSSTAHCTLEVMK